MSSKLLKTACFLTHRIEKVAMCATAICAATASAATLTHRWSFNGTTDTANLTDSVGNVTATMNTDRITWDGTNMVMRGNGEGKWYTGLELGNNLLDTSAATIEVWATPRVQRNYMGIFEYAETQKKNIRWRFYAGGNYNHQCAAEPGAVAAEEFRNTLDEPAHFSATFSTSGSSTTVRFMRRNAKTGAIEYEKTIPTTTSIADFDNPRLFIGGTMWPDATPDADYDEVRIWSGVLGDDQLAANVLAGPDTPLGGGASGVVIPANTTFTVPTTGGYGFRTSNTVTIESGAKIRFDTTDYFGTGLRFKTGGCTVPSGSVTDYVELSDPENYEILTEDSGNTILVQLNSTLAYESTWIGGTPTSASDFTDPDNWESKNAAGTAVSAAPFAKTTVTISPSVLASVSLPPGTTLGWGRVLLGGHTATRYGYKDGAPNSMYNAWRDIAFSGYTTVSAVPDGSNDISYFTGTKDTPGTPSELGTAQIRLDGWFYVTSAQAGFWSMPNKFDDVLSFAIDGEWVLLNSTYRYANGAGAYVSEGWHRFTLAAAETDGGWGSRYKFADSVYVPFVISINGGENVTFSADNFTFGSGSESIVLSADADWSAYGPLVLANGVTIDLNGHSLVIGDIDSSSIGVGAGIVNTAAKKSVLVFSSDPTMSPVVTKGLVSGVGSSIMLAQAGSLSATWTGAAGNGNALDSRNWIDTLTNEAVVPNGNYDLTIVGTAVNLQIPSGTAFACKSINISNCTFTDDCDWTGLSVKPTISGTANLNGHNLTMPAIGLTAMSNSAFSNSAAADSEVRFYANDYTVTATEATFIDGIANLTTAANAKIAIIHSSGDGVGTLNVGAANNHTVFRAEADTISMTATGRVGMDNGGTGYLDIAGGTVDFCTAKDRGLQLGGANASSYVNISSGTLQANWIDAGHAGVVECSIVQTGGEVKTGINNNGNLWLGRVAGGSATYLLSGGSINVTQGTLDVGNYGTGVFVQDGGTVTIGNSDIRLATFGGSNGKYTLNDGDISVMFWIHVGYQGFGAFTQNGGNVVLEGKNNNWLCFGQVAAGNGTYTMNDGSLRVQNGIKTLVGAGHFELNGGTVVTPTIWKQGGTFTVNLNGGTLKASADGYILNGIDDVMLGNGTAIDTAGFYVSVSNCDFLAESGSSFEKTGEGMLSIPVIPPADTVTVSQGTLALTADSDNRNGSNEVSLAHRWSFESDYSDSVGNADGTAIGTALAINNGAVVMSGSGHGKGSLNLGTGLMPTGDATVEIWATRTGSQSYSRVFDIGTSQTDYFTMLWEVGTDVSQDRVEILKGNARKLQSDNKMVYDSNVKYHISVTFKANGDGSTTVIWTRRNAATGEVEKSGFYTPSEWTLADISAGNFYLGYSQYGGDADANAAYDEVRIWNGALSADALTLSAQKGPDASADDIAAVAALSAAPAARTLEVASGATLDLGGNSLAQPVVTGCGTIRNGSLVVTETLSPAGDGTVGAISLTSATVVTGTVSLDVGDVIEVGEGSLDLSGTKLELSDPDNIDGAYVFVTSQSGAITGKPQYQDLKDMGYDIVTSADRKRLIITNVGTVILIR